MARRAANSDPLKSQSNQNFIDASEAWASADSGSQRSACAIALFALAVTSFVAMSPESANTMRASASPECARPKGITLSCLLKIRYGFLRIEEVKSRVVISPPQILIVRLRIPRSIPRELTLLLRHQLQFHLIRNAAPISP